MPTQAYYHFDVRFARSAEVAEQHIRALVAGHGFSLANFSYRLDRDGSVRRYSMTIASADRSAAGRLAASLEKESAIQEFRIAPTGD